MRDLEVQLRAYGSVLDAARPTVVDTVDVRPVHARRSLIVAAATAFVVAIAACAIAFGVTRSRGSHGPDVVTPGSSSPTPTAPKSETLKVRAHLVVTAIGDSVMEGSEGALRDAIPGITVDAVKSRQFNQVAQIVDVDARAGQLPATVVIHIGTNGRVARAELDDIMRAAGHRRVYFLTIRVPRLWENEVNTELRALPSRWPNAHVVEWHDYANTHDTWFVNDGFHLTIAGQHAYAAFVAHALGVPAVTPTTPTTVGTDAGGIGVVDVVAGGDPPYPLAVAGGDVWIASQVLTGSTRSVELERRDPSTATVLGTTDVPQPAVFGIAGDGDALWVAGGGAAGVPRTTVSRVDTNSGKVVFTKTLDGLACSCPIVAGDAGVWLVGNGSRSALHLSRVDGHVTGTVRLAAGSRSATELRGRLLVGLDDGTISVIDPSSDRVERSLPLPTIGDPPVEKVAAMAPAAIPAIGPDPAIDGLFARAGGDVDVLGVSSWQVGSVAATDFAPATIVNVGSFVWSLGGDRLEVFSTHAVSSSEFAYDEPGRRFTRSPRGFGAGSRGFRNAVAVGDRLWVVYDPGAGEMPTIVVLRAPNALP